MFHMLALAAKVACDGESDTHGHTCCSKSDVVPFASFGGLCGIVCVRADAFYYYFLIFGVEPSHWVDRSKHGA
jgi:hypothetical protein